jgi:hypothetical protein
LLQVLVLAAPEDGVVVGFDEAVFEEFAVDFAEIECEATILC